MMNVLIAINGSKESLHAVRKIALLPFREPPRIHLFMAVMEFHHLDMPAEMRRELAEQQNGEAAEALAEAKKILAPRGWEVHASAQRGHPNSLILEHAAAAQADLIALGAAGHNAAFRFLLGSTADYVANHAKCPVLVVRPDDKAADGVALRSVGIAYDGGEQAKLAVEQAMQFDWASASAPVVIVRVIEMPPLLPEDQYMMYSGGLEAEAEKELAALADSLRDRCEVQTVVKDVLDAGRGLCEEFSERHLSLIFIGDTGKGAIGRFFLGSVSRHVLHAAPGGVWIARAKNWAAK